jgi:mono/diheme cytochrome c family protein
MLNMVLLSLLFIAAALLVWLTARTRRIHNRIGRWSAVTAAALATIATWALGVLAIAGSIKAHGRTAPTPTVRIAATPQQIERGKAVSDSFCGGCHSKYGEMIGGMDVGKEITVPIGSFVAANLTPAGDLAKWTDGEIFRAIRNGVGAHGNWLTIMSYTNAAKLSDADTEALIAYIRSLPAQGARTIDPPDHLSLLGLIMLGAGLLPAGNPVFTGAITAPPKGPNARYGAYILSYQDCRDCHGADLSGGVPGQLGPIGPNLALVRTWKVDQFINTMRNGVDPYGHAISEVMPWRALAKMDDDELTAVYEYLK